MTLNEQFLKRKRVYFHGSKTDTLDIKNAHYDCFFYRNVKTATSLVWQMQVKSV